MKILGNAIAGGTYTDHTPDLPRATTLGHGHRPWCVDCKRKHDPDQLDTDQPLGVTAHDVKVWAAAQGLIEQVTTGLVAGSVIDAYAEAHPTTTNQSGDTAA